MQLHTRTTPEAEEIFIDLHLVSIHAAKSAPLKT
jgi:hypothetical protein